MKKFIAMALCALLTPFLVKGVDFQKLPMGSEEALIRYVTTNSTYVGINCYQSFDDGDWVWVTSNKGKFTTFEQFKQKLKTYLTNAINGAKTVPGYDQTLPVLFHAYGGHQEGFYLADTFYILGTEDDDFNNLRIQFPRTGVALKFKSAVTRARLEVLDRKRNDPSFLGPLFYRYIDTDVSPTDDRIYIGTDGDVLVQDQFLINGGSQGPWDVFIELTFADGAVRRYDGNGDPIESTYRLFIRPDGKKIDIMGGTPGQRVVVESAVNLNGPWYPEPEKAVVRNGPTTVPSNEPYRFFRIKQ